MEKTKLSLANVQGKLSRAEMKNVMAGSGGAGNACTGKSKDDCSGGCTQSNGAGGNCKWITAWDRCACAAGY